ncbi:inorganic phosphate transporter [Gloeophyllum trabeum ATCC 11539]|uniref:Inorganic phosphate transporter n=1 Tax=Gloeophyllum trabeum (strain ATCC 11539 / FP-39264 / Madison 617) TaxID=670483 RepID=S7Q629_GLOTA|nr:inorganic phosphate transporter [Gloeophyllum trabeum ATCC 11539]EPQ54923.1 inorganic phosphate transporter [Gloeophyllum trabeum ATCC 11539]
MFVQEKSAPASEPVAQDNSQYRSGLEEYERSGEDRPPFYLTYAEVKLLGITGVGFFLDAYDLFIINPVATMLQYRLYGGASLPAGLEGFIKAAANIGSVIGQFGFGYAADYFGRKAIYGKELMLIIFATILTICVPTGSLSANGSLIWLGVFRIILGIGIGGDYPMSASITTDRARLRKRGTLLAYIFANQGWGSFVGSLMTIVVLACYKHVMNDKDETSKADGVWRVIVGLSLIPAFGTLYQRLTLPESKRFMAAKNNDAEDEKEFMRLKQQGDLDLSRARPSQENSADGEVVVAKSAGSSSRPSTSSIAEEKRERDVEQGAGEAKEAKEKRAAEIAKERQAHWAEFRAYFSEWKHLRILLGTCSCWFLLDVAFYGVNLNQNVVLQQIGFDGSSGTPWERLFKIAIGNIIVTALGFVPGYYATVLTIEKLGRKWIQVQGFLMAALFLGILAGMFHTLSTPAFIVCFALLQFFFNFGANATTYCYPAEVFPTKFRGAAHGMSAACGKLGAIISALAFNSLSKKIGTDHVLWIFFGCCIVGAACTFLLPEVRGRDPDVVYAEEMKVKHAKAIS